MSNIAVFVSGGGSNLQALIDKVKNGHIALVIASRDGIYAIERAKKYNIPYVTIERKNYSSLDDFDEAIIKILKTYHIDLAVLTGYLCILGSHFINEFRNRIINIHPSLIPSFCGSGFYGLKVHEAALERGVKITGATVHFVNEIPDGGPIIMQKAVKVKDNDTPERLQKRVMKQAEWKILPEAVDLFCKGYITVIDNKVYIKR